MADSKKEEEKAVVHTDNAHIEIWKTRRLIQRLDAAKGYFPC